MSADFSLVASPSSIEPSRASKSGFSALSSSSSAWVVGGGGVGVSGGGGGGEGGRGGRAGPVGTYGDILPVGAGELTPSDDDSVTVVVESFGESDDLETCRVKEGQSENMHGD